MTRVSHLLLLGGSAEARAIAQALAQTDLRVVASVYDADHWSDGLGLPVRSGGFGGEDGFKRFLKGHGITAVLDATHPFATRISARTWRICHQLGVPYVQVDRPGWVPGDGDHWTEVDTAQDAITLTQPGQRYFVTTGRETLPAFQDATDRVFFFRRLTDHCAPSDLSHVTYVPGQGPFSVADETALFRDLAVDAVICKNAGGAVSRTKLDAAHDLGLPVILLRKPPTAGGPSVRSVDAALEWVGATCP